MAPRLVPVSVPARGGDNCLPLHNQHVEEAPLEPWVPPADPLEAEWKAVQRTIPSEEFSRLLGFRKVVQARGLDQHKACTVPGAQPHSKKAATLLRFLRARNGNAEVAASMFKEALDWRRDFEVDRKLKEWRCEWEEGTSARVQLLKTYTYIGLLGADREGLPVYIHRHSQGDVGGIVREIGQEFFLMYLVHMMEDMFEQAERKMLQTGRFFISFVEIHDVANYGLVPGWAGRGFGAVPFFKNNAPIFDKVYPERVRVCIMVRVPTAFAMIWNIFLPLVPEQTKSKIRLKGQKVASFLPDLQEVLPQASIPAFLQTDDRASLAQAKPWAGIVPKGCLAELEEAANGPRALKAGGG